MTAIEIHTGTGCFESPPTLFQLLRQYRAFETWWPDFFRFIGDATDFQFRIGLLHFNGKEVTAVDSREVIWKVSTNFQGRWEWELKPRDHGTELQIHILGQINGGQRFLRPFMSYESRIRSACRSLLQAMQVRLAQNRQSHSG